jgi:hypothetical protein
MMAQTPCTGRSLSHQCSEHTAPKWSTTKTAWSSTTACTTGLTFQEAHQVAGRARGRALRSQALLGLFEEPYGRARRGQGLARLRHLRQQQPEGERSPREKARASRQKARGFSAGGTTPCRRPAWPGKPATRLARRRLNPPPGFSSRGGTAREGPQKGLTGSREREDQASIGLCSSAFPGKATLQTLDFHPGSS